MNQEFVYPEQTKVPKWVTDKLNAFHAQLKIDTGKFKDEFLQNAIVDNLEENILYSDIKIKNVLDKKGIGQIIKQTSTKTSDLEFMWYYYLIMQAGFTLSSVIPSPFEPKALTLPEEFHKDKNEAVARYNNSNKTTEDALRFQQDITKIAKKVKKYFEDNNVHVVDLMNSKAKGNISHIQSLLLSVGLSINSFGEINDVISNSHLEGLTQTQFFNGSSQAIQALYAKSSETAKPGYLGRKLGVISERIKLSSTLDCGSQNYLSLKIRDKDMLQSLAGKTYRNKLGILVQLKEDDDVIGKTLQFRDSLYCKARDGICHTCYNKDYINKMKLVAGDNIGLIASTSMTGTLVDLTLKKSHVGVGLDQDEVNFRKELELD